MHLGVEHILLSIDSTLLISKMRLASLLLHISKIIFQSSAKKETYMKGPLFGLGDIKTISNLFLPTNSMLASLPICSSWKLKMG